MIDYTKRKELQETIGKLAQDNLDLVRKAGKENENKQLNLEQNAEFDKRRVDLSKAEADLRDLEEAIEAEKRSGVPSQAKAEKGKDQAAFERWLFKGPKAMSPDEVRTAKDYNETVIKRATMSTGGVGSGAELTTARFVKDFYNVVYSSGDVLPYVNVINDNVDEAIHFPVISGDDLGEVVSETASSVTTAVSPTTSEVVLGGYQFGSKPIKISFAMLKARNGLESQLASILGGRVGKIMGRDMTIGNGSSTAQGFVTGASDSGVISASATVPTFDKLQDLVHSIADAERNSDCAFYMTDATRLKYEKINDAAGNPIFFWRQYQQDFVPVIAGYKIVNNRWMDAYTASKKPVVFGNLKKGYVARVVDGINLLVTDEHTLTRVLTAWVIADGKVLDSNIIKYLSTPAS